MSSISGQTDPSLRSRRRACRCRGSTCRRPGSRDGSRAGGGCPAPPEGPEQHGHAREAERVAQRVDIRRDHPEILRDHGQRPELGPAGSEQRDARARRPPPLARGLRAGRHRPVRGEAPEVVDPETVDEPERAAHAIDPPAVARRGDRVPVVERVAPELSARVEIVGRRAGDRPRRRGGRARGARGGRSRRRRRRSARRRRSTRRASAHARAPPTTRARTAPAPRRRRRPRTPPSRRSTPPRARGTRGARPARPGRPDRRGGRPTPRRPRRRCRASRPRREDSTGASATSVAPAAASQSTKAYASAPSRPPGSDVGWSSTPSERSSRMAGLFTVWVTCLQSRIIISEVSPRSTAAAGPQRPASATSAGRCDRRSGRARGPARRRAPSARPRPLGGGAARRARHGPVRGRVHRRTGAAVIDSRSWRGSTATSAGSTSTTGRSQPARRTSPASSPRASPCSARGRSRSGVSRRRS